MSLATMVLQFAIGAALIGAAGFVLSREADRLATAYGWGRGWVGLALLATVTSLPELASGLSAVVWVDAPDLAIGDALGSCVFNLLFLVAIDALQRGQPMYRDAASTHLLTAAFGVVMLGFVAMSLLLAARSPRLFHLGLYSPLMLGLYLFAIASVRRQESRKASITPAHAPDVRRTWIAFALAALVVVATGFWLPAVADQLATRTGLGRSFVGTLWLAFATSLPEIAVTLAALRLKALDLAIGNLLGSNLFNVAVLAVDDAAYLKGPLLENAATVHGATAVSAMTMTGLVVIGLVMRPQGRVLRVASWVSVGLLAAYLLNAVLLYLHDVGGR
jgi:cation:H+ antiporter